MLSGLFKYTFSLLLVISLALSSGILSLILYAKISGNALDLGPFSVAAADDLPGKEEDPEQSGEEEGKEAAAEEADEPLEPLPAQAKLSAPAIHQYPELVSGCEVTSLTMLLQFYGLDVDKMQMAAEMPKDPTPLQLNPDGTIAYWGNPNLGFVGEVTAKARGFGIYHTALFEQLKEHIPTAIDLTGGEFSDIERQIANGIPVVAWTTINFLIPDRWVVWDTPIGPIKTTFIEHAVLVVGYDEHYIYVNDPYSGKADVPVERERFIETWELLGRQSISYLE
ncbi:C39 family peptidase [Paenibacillus senegalensis]|uniref:C39 family peptidase n=1 Tax=Paenibacillus senegalensis TaxID=1465766 RepID=UPI000288683F|nr:C39 family peptidase [Paenibacillus senegalensis]